MLKKKSKTKAYIFGDEKDATRVNELAKNNQHKIEMLELKEDVTINKRSSQKFKLYYSGRAAKHKAYQCYFDKQTIFKDSLFYDISA
jgi:hypothetical protein